MSRQETDREDLLREATALVERAELMVADWSEPLVVGFRRDGSASLFFGADPVYQFNTQSELRRGFVSGLLFKAEQGRLVELRRERSEHEVALVRRELAATEESELLAKMQQRLNELRSLLDEGKFQIVGQVPMDGNVVGQIRKWLAGLPAEIVVARVPNVR